MDDYGISLTATGLAEDYIYINKNYVYLPSVSSQWGYLFTDYPIEMSRLSFTTDNVYVYYQGRLLKDSNGAVSVFDYPAVGGGTPWQLI